MTASIKRFHFSVSLITALFLVHFLLPRDSYLGFWWRMALIISLGIFMMIALGDARLGKSAMVFSRLRVLVWGVGSALLLYGLFWLGQQLVIWLFSGSSDRIAQVYAFKSGYPQGLIALLMALVIGPGEEILWRGLIQARLQVFRPRLTAFLITTALYTLIHLGTGNPILVLAALVCGSFWGGLYLYSGSVWLCVISHTVWDLAIFIVFPLA